MLALEFFKWWYGAGWARVLRKTKDRLSGLSQMFSIAILLRTLFSPWRRIISYPGAGIDAHLRAIGDNLVSRAVGFMVRISVLLCAAIAFIALVVFALLEIIVWPLMPLASVGLIVWGLK